MLITQASLDALRVSFDTRFGAAYSGTPTFYERLCTDVPSSSRKNVYGWIAQAISLREWVGPRTPINLAEHSAELVNKSFEGTIELDRDDLEDAIAEQSLASAGLAVAQLGEATRKHPDRLLASVVKANAVTWDGKNLFDTDHPCFDEAATTYDNEYDLALSADNINTVYAGMSSITGENGDPLGVSPTVIMVPPQLRKTALEAMSAATVATGGTNVMQGWMDVLVVPEFADDATQWYMFDAGKILKPFVYQKRRAPEFVTRNTPTDPDVFNTKKLVWGVDYRCAMGPTLPFLAARSKP